MEEKVRRGRFIGIRKDGVDIFRGITYARYERFREAVTLAGDTDVDATTWGTVCPQRSSRLADILGEDNGPVCEEGRLCLSIYVPTETGSGNSTSVTSENSIDTSGSDSDKSESGKGLPVMVWIHGGAFLTGGSEEHRYSGERLVKTGNVIVVKTSYRLGAFGYLYLPEKGICNLGLKDQKLALEWIQREIGAFGGDPDNVTLFGQSAGAQSIAALIATCEGKPPFSKVIMQSTPLGIGITTEEATDIATGFCKALGKDIQTASTDEILDAQAAVQGYKTGLTFMPVIKDYKAVPECIVKGQVKFVIGYTRDDASPFLKDILGKMLGTFIGKIIVRATTRKIFSKDSDGYAVKLKKLGLKVQKYFISWHPEGNPMGSCHCIELPFILGEREDWAKAQMLEGMTEEEFSANSEACLKAWTEFANTGCLPSVGILSVK